MILLLKRSCHSVMIYIDIYLECHAPNCDKDVGISNKRKLQGLYQAKIITVKLLLINF
jgi:hypothetical protein